MLPTVDRRTWNVRMEVNSSVEPEPEYSDCIRKERVDLAVKILYSEESSHTPTVFFMILKNCLVQMNSLIVLVHNWYKTHYQFVNLL